MANLDATLFAEILKKINSETGIFDKPSQPSREEEKNSWKPTGLDMILHTPAVQDPTPELVVAPEEELDLEDVDEPVEDDESSSQINKGPSSPMSEALKELEEMEDIIPLPKFDKKSKKRVISEDSDSLWEEFKENEEDSGTSTKRRKLSTPKSSRKPIRWSTRKKSKAETEGILTDPEVHVTSVPKTRSNMGDTPAESSKEVMEELGTNKDFLLKNKLSEVFELLDFQGWISILSENEPVDKGLVSEFFQNVSTSEKGPVITLNFSIKGQQLMVTSREIAALLGLKHEGFDGYAKKAWPENISDSEKEEMENLVCNYSDPKQNELSTNHMEIRNKVLHRFLVHSLLPRKSKTARAQIQDILVLDQILRKKKINWAKLIIRHIEYISEYKEVGYARIVRKILELSCAYEPEVESTVQKPLTTYSIHRWGFTFTDAQGWVKKDYRAVPEKGESSKVIKESESSKVQEALDRMENKIEAQTEKIAKLKLLIKKGFRMLKTEMKKSASRPRI